MTAPAALKKPVRFVGEGTFLDHRRNSVRVEARFFTLFITKQQAGYRFGAVAAKRTIGGAVERNRAKRRLRAAYAELLPTLVPSGVLLYAKKSVLTGEFCEIVQTLTESLAHALGSDKSH